MTWATSAQLSSIFALNFFVVETLRAEGRHLY
jgi:hypothetical protein